MKRMIALLAAAALLACAALPAFALTVRDEAVYNAHDLEKLAALLEQTDAEGVKNGNKLSETYDPSDPTTWGESYYGGPCFRWEEYQGERHVSEISVDFKELAGTLDVSGCSLLNIVMADGNDFTGVDISDCERLSYLRVYENLIAEIDVSVCPSLYFLEIGGNLLTELDVTQNPNLNYISIGANNVSEIDTSNCPDLEYLYCVENNITSFDLSNNPRMYRITVSGNPITTFEMAPSTYPDIVECLDSPVKCIDMHLCETMPVKALYAEGAGTVGFGYYSSSHDGRITAVPDEGESFIGWYTPDGELFSEEATVTFEWEAPSMLIARFSGEAALRGDADLNGVIDTTDALLALRCALGISGRFVDMPHCDMDGSANIDTIDALLILRAALGIS